MLVEAIDVNPPRATKSDRWIQGFWSRQKHMLRSIFGVDFEKKIFPYYGGGEFEGRLIDFLYLAFGGLYQFVHHGKRVWIAVWLPSMLLGFLLFGTVFGAYLFGIAYGVHVASVVTLLVPKEVTFFTRIRATLLVGVLIGSAYLSLLLLAGYVLIPIRIEIERRIYHRGRPI